jgi:uncharacterized protein
MTDDQGAAGLQVLDAHECYELLGTQEVGRLGVTAEHYPLIIPVNYGMDGQVVVVRTHPGTILAAADHANVTFEVDEIDPATRTGWSVLVRGLAEQLTPQHHADLVERTRQAGREPWAPGEHTSWVRIITHDVSGRRIGPGQLPSLAQSVGSL